MLDRFKGIMPHAKKRSSHVTVGTLMGGLVVSGCGWFALPLLARGQEPSAPAAVPIVKPAEAVPIQPAPATAMPASHLEQTEEAETTATPISQAVEKQDEGVYARLGDRSVSADSVAPVAPADTANVAVKSDGVESATPPTGSAVSSQALQPQQEGIVQVVALPPVTAAGRSVQPTVSLASQPSEPNTVTEQASAEAPQKRLLDPSQFMSSSSGASAVQSAVPASAPVQPAIQRLPSPADAVDTSEAETPATVTQVGEPAVQADVVVQPVTDVARLPKVFASPNQFLRLPQVEAVQPIGSADFQVLPPISSPEEYLAAAQAPVVYATDSMTTARAADMESSIVRSVRYNSPVSSLPPVQYSNRSYLQEVENEQGSDVKLRPLSDNPLSNLAYKPTEDRGNEVPTDIASNRFGDWSDATVQTEVVRMRMEDMDYVMWNSQYALWEAPGFYHRPLYFEQINLERYGHYRPVVQPAISGALFFATIPILPYQMGVHGPCEPIYTLGHFRPGSCNPHHIHRIPFSWRGVAYQSLATTGAIFALPTVP